MLLLCTRLDICGSLLRVSRLTVLTFQVLGIPVTFGPRTVVFRDVERAVQILTLRAVERTILVHLPVVGGTKRLVEEMLVS